MKNEKTYKNPEIAIQIYIKNDKGYIGIDIAGRNLAKRDYKVFTGAASMRGTVAYDLLLEAEVKDTDVILSKHRLVSLL